MIDRHGKGQKVAYICEKVDLGEWVVRGILKQAANDENDASDAA